MSRVPSRNDISLEELSLIAKQRPKKRPETDWLSVIVPSVAIVGLLGGLAYAVQANRTLGNRVGVTLGQALWGSALIENAQCELAWNHGRLSSTRVVVFKVKVRNETRAAIEYLTFYARSKNPKRAVPIGESTNVVKIPGGIEPGESKEVSFSVSASTFGSTEYHPIPSEPFEIAIVDESQNVSRDMPMRPVATKFN